MSHSVDKASPYGIEQVPHGSTGHKSALGQLLQSPLPKAKKDEHPSFRLDFQANPSEFLLCQRITPRKSLQRTILDMNLNSRASLSTEIEARPEPIMKRNENERTIVIRKRSSRGVNLTSAASKINSHSALELLDQPKIMDESQRTKTAGLPLKTDSFLNTTRETWRHHTERPPPGSPRIQVTGIQLSQRPQTKADDNISLLYEFLGDKKTPYDPIKQKNSIVDPAGSYHINRSYFQPYRGLKNGSHDESMYLEPSVQTEAKSQSGILAFKASFNNIGIHLVKKTYVKQKSLRTPKAESASLTQRSARIVKLSYRQDSIQIKEESELLKSEKSQVAEDNEKGAVKFNELFSLMKGIANQKVWKQSSLDPAKKKNYVPYSKMKSKIQKIKNRTQYVENDSSLVVEKLGINQIKLSPRGSNKQPNNQKKKEEPSKIVLKKIRLSKTRNTETKLSDASPAKIEEPRLIQKSLSTTEKISTQEVIFHHGLKAVVKEPIKELRKEPRKCVKSYSKSQVQVKEELTKTKSEVFQRTGTLESLEIVVRETSRGPLERQLMIQQGKQDTLQGWDDMEL